MFIHYKIHVVKSQGCTLFATLYVFAINILMMLWQGSLT